MLDVLLQVRPQPMPIVAVALHFISIGLLVALLVLFFTTWRKTKAPFSLGLVLFAGVLLLEDLTRIGQGLGWLSPRAELLPDVFELVALVVLLYLATR
jgi:ABC-type polysaccharide/polyol phosphate export permease